MSETFEAMRISLFNDTFTKMRQTQILAYDDSADIENVTKVLDSLLNSGWLIDEVFVDTSTGITPVNATDPETILALLDALIEETYDTTHILVYGEAFGWEEEYFATSRYSRGYREGYYQESSSRRGAAEEYHNEMYGEVVEDGYLVIDWESTARQMEYDSWTFHNRNGYVYLLTSE